MIPAAQTPGVHELASAAADAYALRARDALLLPFKRRIASWLIRADIWQEASAPGAKNAAARAEATERARNAVVELDEQVVNLSDIKFPDTISAKLVAGELADMKKSYTAIRATLVEIGAKAA